MMEKHPHLQPKMRAILLDWLIEVCSPVFFFISKRVFEMWRHSSNFLPFFFPEQCEMSTSRFHNSHWRAGALVTEASGIEYKYGAQGVLKPDIFHLKMCRRLRTCDRADWCNNRIDVNTDAKAVRLIPDPCMTACLSVLEARFWTQNGSWHMKVHKCVFLFNCSYVDVTPQPYLFWVSVCSLLCSELGHTAFYSFMKKSSVS